MLIKSNIRNYNVIFTENFAKNLNMLIKDTKCYFIIDKNVYKIYNKNFLSIDKNKLYLIDAKETKKNLEESTKLIEFFLQIFP